MELAFAGEEEGAVILAEEQTAGRGRVGRKWHSEQGTGIYVTLLLRPRMSPVSGPAADNAGGTFTPFGHPCANRPERRVEMAERYSGRMARNWAGS